MSKLFLEKIAKSIEIQGLREDDRQLLLNAKKKIEDGYEWRETLLGLLTNLNAEAMALKLSPGLREFYSLLYNNRASLEDLKHDIKGSMTLLMIFD
ncbi:bacteriocin immunity protein [Lactococcus fujiensis]|uniref:bacteriocin immunity protein n=1 Tax=Lactococcus fujiensis TaxID=610251 RepID=UPI002092E446|nr:bacteriocin immunity protein [Lactococcus fujiensis]